MFRVKICGITRPEDAVAAAEAGADAIGLNFYVESPRSVTPERAAEVARAVAGGPLLVGVFVNASSDVVSEAVEAAGLQAIQLHGDESVQAAIDLVAGVPLVRATRMGREGLAPVAAQQAEASKLGRPFAAILADAAGAAGEYGGTGRVADWSRFRTERAALGATPAILAGGLTPANVSEAISATRCDGVDTASGVESAPGVKDANSVGRFVEAALAAFSESR